jgi:hypothetical protein
LHEIRTIAFNEDTPLKMTESAIAEPDQQHIRAAAAAGLMHEAEVDQCDAASPQGRGLIPRTGCCMYACLHMYTKLTIFACKQHLRGLQHEGMRLQAASRGGSMTLMSAGDWHIAEQVCWRIYTRAILGVLYRCHTLLCFCVSAMQQVALLFYAIN